MAKLIGTGTNQVPTNGMLGGMAFQTPEDVTVKKIQEEGYNVVTQTDIGTAPNQIPLNQFLGGLAYMDSVAGLDFSATSSSSTGTVTSQILDDYEEGTFTVTMQYYSSGWVDATFSNTPYTTGYYVKVGNLCTAYYYSTDFQLNVGNGAGALFTGLPFAVANLTQGYGTGTVTHVTCFQQTNQNVYVAPNASYIVPIQSNSTTTSTWNNNANVYIMWSVTYRTN